MATMDDKGLNYVALAPTNKAATIINGMTIHRFAISCSKKNVREMKLDYIIVVEVSKLQEMFYKCVCSIGRAFPSIRFIMSGEFSQLEPGNYRVKNCDYKNSIVLHEIADGKTIQLAKCRRADDTLLNRIKPQHIHNTDKTKFGSTYSERHIVFTNNKRIEINAHMMEAYYKKKQT